VLQVIAVTCGSWLASDEAHAVSTFSGMYPSHGESLSERQDPRLVACRQLRVALQPMPSSPKQTRQVRQDQQQGRGEQDETCLADFRISEHGGLPSFCYS